MTPTIYIGWTADNAIAAEVCKHSILRRASQGINIVFLKQEDVADICQKIPNENQSPHLYTRFLLPYLQGYQGTAIYIDSSLIVLDDICKLFTTVDLNTALARVDVSAEINSSYDYSEIDSMLMVINCAHPFNSVLNAEFINFTNLDNLLKFRWLPNDVIVNLAQSWNCLVDNYNEKISGRPLALNFFQNSEKNTNQDSRRYYSVWLREQIEMQRPPPPPRHELDMVTNDVGQVLKDVLKYRVDPMGDYYGITLQKLQQSIVSLDTGTVAAIDSEFRYEEKGKVYDPILQSFVQGCGGRLSYWDKEANSMTPVVFRGITKRKEMRACKAAERDFYYIDTGYFGNLRKKTYHRVTKNDVQYFGDVIERPFDRLAKTGVRIQKHRPGSKILVAPPSQKLLNLYDINLEQWMEQTLAEIKQHTDREVIVRLKKGRSERVTTDTMEMALNQDIHCLVTFSSIAAGEALLLGKPAITLGPNAAAPLCSQSLAEIENPIMPTVDEVQSWAAHIAYCQFTEPEMRDGTAWRILNSG